MVVPEEPITLPSGAYGIWPVNLELNGVRLRYSTAQLMNRLDHNGDTYVFFFSTPGIVPELLLEAPASVMTAEGFQSSRSAKGLLLRARSQSGEIVIRSGKGSLHLVLLPRTDAENMWKVNDGRALLLTKVDVFSDGSTITLQQEADSSFQFNLFGASSQEAKPTGQSTRTFVPYQSSVPVAPLEFQIHQIALARTRAPLKYGPQMAWRKTPIPMAPEDAEFANAARWTLTLQGSTKALQLADVLMRVRYQGDLGRLRQSGKLLDDNFWNGLPWTIGAKAAGLDLSLPIDLELLPLPPGFPMFLQHRPEIDAAAKSGSFTKL